MSEAPALNSIERAPAADDGQTKDYGNASYGLIVDPKQRELSRVFFTSVYQASEGVPSGWTGNVSQGVAGTTSPAFQNAVALRINYFRALAGVPAAVTLSGELNAEDQQDALMMSANDPENHQPPATQIDDTAEAAAAAANSVAIYQINGPLAVTNYIRANDHFETSVGSRRDVLYPPQTVMGTGDVDGSPDGLYFAANALWVLDKASYTHPVPAARDGFVAWPPPGFVPRQLVFPRWSFSYPHADFSSATVSMRSGGRSITVAPEPVENGYGDNTLVWIQAHLAAASADLPADSDRTYHVTVAHVLIGGTPRAFTYRVTTFDPAVPGADQVLPAITGASQIPVGQQTAYKFNAVPGATSYQWTARTLSPLVLLDDAANGLGNVTVAPAGENVLATDPADGMASYNLLSYPVESLTLDPMIVPAAGSALHFASDLGFATPDETAQVQISTDGGNSWQDLFAQTGSGGATQGVFTAQSIDLSRYAGQACQLRFIFSLGGEGNYSKGWFVNNISVLGAQTLGAGLPTPVTSGSGFTFTPPSAASYALQVTPVFFGSYPADAGPLTIVSALPP